MIPIREIGRRTVPCHSGTRLISHDGRGNQITEQFPGGVTVTVAYDGHARLTRYRNGGASQTMLYNGMDERIQVVTTPAIGSADTRVYLYDLDHRIVGEYGATGTADIKAEYIWLMPEVGATGPTGGDDGLGGYMPLATAVGQTGRLNWLHTHHHGAPILTTNAAGTVVPYPAHAVLGFPGQFANSQQLAGAQHYYNRYRDYDVNTGRYIQADPIGLAGDDNPYAYARGNPLRYVDPSGEYAILGAFIGGGGNLAWQLWKSGGRLGCVDAWEVAGWALTGATLGKAGPAGPLFGRLRYRQGIPSLFNSGNFRVGWSWNQNGWLGARNYFGVHGGVPKTPSHWHATPIPGPKTGSHW